MAYQPKSHRKFVATAATATLVATAVTPALAAPTQGASENFTDVPERYKEAVDYLVGQKITIGETPTKYGTQNNIKRVDVAVMVARATLDPEVIENAPLSSFTDVPDRARLYVDALKHAGVINGKTTTNFGAADSITRGEAAIMLANAYGLKTKGETQSKFTDVSSRYAEAVEKLVDNNITNGKTTTSFGTADPITRGELALFLYKLEKLEGPGEGQVPGYTLQLSSKDASLDANGADNTVITAKIIDNETGQVDVDADDIVLQFDASHGSLANTRVTVKDGVATVLLTSEFSQKELTSVVTAKLIETAPDSEWADQIGKLIAAQTVKFVPVSGSVTSQVEITGAESNQADRVTVYFNENVTPASFLDTTSPLYNKVEVTQNNEDKAIVGYLPVEGNSKAIQVLLAKSDYLTDNKEVDVTQLTSKGQTIEKSFILTDARQPEATSVQQVAYNQLEVTFSESIANVDPSQVKIDGGLVGIKSVSTGDYNAVTGADKRNVLTVTTNSFIKPGDHSIQLSGIKDFAGLTDPANISTNQIFDFTVAANNVIPAANITVESPEQMRLQFNTMVENFDKPLEEVDFQVYDPREGVEDWVSLKTLLPAGVSVSDVITVTEVVPGVEYLYELKQDWTKIFAAAALADNSALNDNYYNHKFRAVIEKDVVNNPANDKKNVKQEIDLSYSGSPLTTPDTVSPTLTGQPSVIASGDYKGQWLVPFSEPVKGANITGEPTTPSVLQEQNNATKDIPNIVVEFIGTDKDGKKVTVPGTVTAYGDKKESSLVVNASQTLQTLVDTSDYATSWQLVVRNVTDDVGNAASTLTQNFTVEKSPAAVVDFKVDTKANGTPAVDFYTNGTEKDQVIVEFTSGVQYTGNTANALNLSNYTLNGQALPKGSVATLEDADANTTNGYEKVRITLAGDNLVNGSNVLNISKDLKSATGLTITGQTEFAANVQVDAPAENQPPVQNPEPVTASDLGVQYQDVVPNTVFNVTIPFSNAQQKLKATTSSTIVLAVPNKDNIELTYQAENNEFAAIAVQGYTKAEINNAVASLKSAN
ncbi:S-layer homology domain-containing protein [Domibacillus sp. PGB-M46]|uniref:S-layer homology domain-containing protein n=1 Tax=Domibacillus sp. PGB-M46 TaxID=2910255 RepID=UPI001F580FD2|nr:S-layer homology domain-containing protein [Domibacillus sp. PGB-M46]MCI2253875.1 S-layer homology domain-containing protein [Domibacillus sp. PGB-M46]